MSKRIIILYVLAYNHLTNICENKLVSYHLQYQLPPEDSC